MGARRGAFPTADAGSILSPRDATGGLGVKMVEYVLGGSPTGNEGKITIGPVDPGGNTLIRVRMLRRNVLVVCLINFFCVLILIPYFDENINKNYTLSYIGQPVSFCL